MLYYIKEERMSNWNSKKKEWSPVKKKETIDKKARAIELRKQGVSIEEIAKKMDLSKSRIYEYLKE